MREGVLGIGIIWGRLLYTGIHSVIRDEAPASCSSVCMSFSLIVKVCLVLFAPTVFLLPSTSWLLQLSRHGRGVKGQDELLHIFLRPPVFACGPLWPSPTRIVHPKESHSPCEQETLMQAAARSPRVSCLLRKLRFQSVRLAADVCGAEI